MSLLQKTIGGIGALIALYLLLFYGRPLVDVIRATGTVSIQGIRALQGRT